MAPVGSLVVDLDHDDPVLAAALGEEPAEVGQQCPAARVGVGRAQSAEAGCLDLRRRDLPPRTRQALDLLGREPSSRSRGGALVPRSPPLGSVGRARVRGIVAVDENQELRDLGAQMLCCIDEHVEAGEVSCRDERIDLASASVPDEVEQTSVTCLAFVLIPFLRQGVCCPWVTDFVAELDESVDRAARGSVVDQLLAQLTTHIGKRHPERALSPDEVSALRDKLSA